MRFRSNAGLWVENGQLDYPEVTIAGNLKKMFQNIEMVGSDLEMRGRLAYDQDFKMTVVGN